MEEQHFLLRLPLRRAAFSLVLGMMLIACEQLALHIPSERFDNKIVRGEVTYAATESDMVVVWHNSVERLPDAPSIDDFLRDFRRVTVRVERHLGGAYFVYPFCDAQLRIEVGDIVDVPVYVGGPRVGFFSGRPQIVRIQCRNADLNCRQSSEGRRRGVVGDVEPRD